MPKTLVLFHGSSDAVAETASAVAEGARAVRFAEVDVRQLTPAGEAGGSNRHRSLSSPDELAAYDGLVLGTTAGAVLPEAVSRLLDKAAELRQAGNLTTSVGAAFTAGASATVADDARWALLRALGGLGVVLVPASGDDQEAARKLGHRVAHVVSWITHARSHDHH
jgi:hypothetical protein